MRILITGINGFAGSHLAEYVLSTFPQCKLFGTIRWRSSLQNLSCVVDKISLVECDLRDAASVNSMIEKIKPDRIFHLAAQSFVQASWNQPADTFNNNVISQVNILESVRRIVPKCRILVVGSSEEYGFVNPKETPITEDQPLRPLSPYGVSKVAQDLMGYQYFKSYGLHIVRTRAFNHEGPRRGNVFVTSNFAKQIAEIESGIQEPIIKVGNLEAIRDYTDVRDTVRGYWIALEHGDPGEVYNICSGHGWQIRDVLEHLINASTVGRIRIIQEASRMRPSDVQLLVGSFGKINFLDGWIPWIPFKRTLNDTLDYWRCICRQNDAVNESNGVSQNHKHKENNINLEKTFDKS